MAEDTKIEWADATWNVWIGCTRVSPGCDNCYAETMAHRRKWHDWGTGERRQMSEGYWRQPAAWNRKAEAEGKPLRVFCSSLADVFDPLGPAEERHRLFELVAETPWLIWMMLTKRPQQMTRLLPADWSVEKYPNVWLGITAEDQKHYDRRWPILRDTPATVRFVSYEPALDAVSLHSGLRGLPDWVICGGESGPGARPMSAWWARQMQKQCELRGIPFFFKQWGTYRNNPWTHAVGELEAKLRDPKTNGKGGALLDGVLYREIPRASPVRSPEKLFP